MRKAFLFLLFFISLPNASALNENYTPSLINEYKDFEYVIDAYDVHIVVNENNSLDITETIEAYLNTGKHGMTHQIPLM